MKPHPLHARKRLDIYDAAHLVALSYGEPWLDAFENPVRAETHHYRRQCVKLVEEAVASGDLVAEVVKEGQKPTIATVDLLVWLKRIAPGTPEPAPIANGNKAQIIGRFEPPEGDALIEAQELKAKEGRITINEAMQTLKAETGEFFNLLAAVKSGEIPSYAPGSQKPLKGNTENCSDVEELYLDDLNNWLETNTRHKFRFQKRKKKVGAGVPVEGDWKTQARVIADECFDHDTKNNCRDSLAGYSVRVMDIMREREIHGPRGLIDNPKTIQRDALQGRLWWQVKVK